MTVLRTIALFVLAAVAEIGGAWLVWQGVREHRGLVWIGAGIAALGAYGFIATLQDDSNFGRILAAYGGIFVAGSLALGHRRRRLPTRPLGLPRRSDLPGRRRRHHVRPPGDLNRTSSAQDLRSPCAHRFAPRSGLPQSRGRP